SRICTDSSARWLSPIPFFLPQSPRWPSLPGKITSFDSHYCALFCRAIPRILFSFNQIRTLCCKTPGGGAPPMPTPDPRVRKSRFTTSFFSDYCGPLPPQLLYFDTLAKNTRGGRRIGISLNSCLGLDNIIRAVQPEVTPGESLKSRISEPCFGE